MSKALHDEIMNIPHSVLGGYSTAQSSAYRTGHRDARHAAAELAITADDAQAELNAARALLREVLDDGVFRQKHISLLKVVGTDWGDKVRAYLDACDKPGEAK